MVLLVCCHMITVMVIMMMTMTMPWFVSFKTDTFGCSLHSLSFYILRLTKECSRYSQDMVD